MAATSLFPLHQDSDEQLSVTDIIVSNLQVAASLQTLGQIGGFGNEIAPVASAILVRAAPAISISLAYSFASVGGVGRDGAHTPC
jgi:hypothetical protein